MGGSPYKTSKAAVLAVAMRVHQLLYISAATRTLSDAELADILAAARSNNARLRVTGVLSHDAGSFIQVLEGAEERVEGLYQKIAVDPRHRRIVVLARQAVVQSSFAEWSMGFGDRAHPSLSAMPGFKDFSGRALDITELAVVKSSAFYLMEAFSVGRLRQYASF